MNSDADPLAPFGSRFPLSPAHGRIHPVAEGRPPGCSRPFGMSQAVQPVTAERHGKRPTQKTRTKQTAIYDDGKISGYTSDVEHYTEMDEQ